MELGIASSPGASGRNQLGRLVSRERPTQWRAYLRALGPGLVTGASDDDPSGVATYAQAGAQFRFGLLWTALITLFLLAPIVLIAVYAFNPSNVQSWPLDGLSTKWFSSTFSNSEMRS